MLFRRRPPKLLDEAFAHFAQAMEILYRHLRDKNFVPDEKELEQFNAAKEICGQNTATAAYISRCMEQRHKGEPEGAVKFTDCEILNWHYPE